MARKQKPEGKKYSYMDTYGDLVTLLMCFFVLLFAMSTIEEEKFNAFAEAMQNQFGGTPTNQQAMPVPADPGEDAGTETPTTGDTMDPDQTLPADFKQLAEAIQEYVQEHNMEGQVTLEASDNNVVFLRMSHNLLFSGNSSALLPQASDFLDFIGECFLQVDDQIFTVQLLGHTASLSGSSTDDRILSSERSGQVASYLERTVGYSPYKMQSIGLGRHYPIADNASDDGVARNRRVDIVVVGNNPETLAQALLEAQQVYFPGDDTQFFEGAPDELPGHVVNQSVAANRELDLANLTDEEMRQLFEIMEELEK